MHKNPPDPFCPSFSLTFTQSSGHCLFIGPYPSVGKLMENKLVSEKHETVTVEMLKTMCRKALALYPTTLAQDEACLRCWKKTKKHDNIGNGSDCKECSRQQTATSRVALYLVMAGSFP